MAQYESFTFSTLDELRQKIESLGLDISFNEDLSVLAAPAAVGERTAPNRFSTLPMEGRDALPDGSPGELTFRRYRRYGAGGWGLIQFEACAVWQGGRSSDRQMWLQPSTEKAIASLLDATRAAAREPFGPSHSPLCLLQLQDAGRYRHATGTTPGLTVRHPLPDRRAKGPEPVEPPPGADIQAVQDPQVAVARRGHMVGVFAIGHFQGGVDAATGLAHLHLVA